MTTQAPHISDEWIAERWPDLDRAEIRRRFNVLMDRLGEGPWRGVGHPDAMLPVVAWAASLPTQRTENLTAALAEVPEHLRDYLWVAEKPRFGEQRVKTCESVVGDSGHGMGRQAIAVTPYIKGYNLARWIAAAAPGNVGALLAELRRLGDRVVGLLHYNNNQVEKRRTAVALLRDAAKLFRSYEKEHRKKAAAFEWAERALDAGASHAKAERNAEIAERIESFVEGVHS